MDQVARTGCRGGQRRPVRAVPPGSGGEHVQCGVQRIVFRAEFAQPAANDPLVALVRSAASDEHAAAHLLVAMQENSAAAYRSGLSPMPRQHPATTWTPAWHSWGHT